MRRLWLAMALAAGLAAAQDVTGDWAGTLDAGALKMRILVHIKKGAAGALEGTMDSLDQNAKGIKVSSITFQDSTLKFSVDVAHGQYEGKLKADGSEIDGTWTQGAPMTLNLKRATGTEDQLQRPQNPAKPYLYKEEEVTYENKLAKIKLAGTLTIPQGKGPFTAVLLITGSGPQDRDESLMGHKPFLVMADYLTRKGIEVLRVDDRGVGVSGGNFATSTTADFATDAEAGVAFLKSRAEVDRHKIGLVGHSEGAVIAPMVAAQNPDVAFIVMMAGPGLSGADLIVEQVRAMVLATGGSQEKADAAANQQRQLVTLVRDEKDLETLKAKLRDVLTKRGAGGSADAAVIQLTSPWYRYFMSLDPAAFLSKVSCPVLAINGEKDVQVPPKQNLPAIRRALEAGGNKKVETVEMPGLNHLFQTAKTGLPSEYSQIEETMAPAALQKIADWIGRQ